MTARGRLAVGLPVVVLAVVVGGIGYLRRSVPPLGGRERVPALRDSVTVLWDSLAVPHIVARSDADAFAALGYLHARDRLWQMELLRRAAEGRLAEILGPEAVPSDRYLRSLDIPRAATRSLALLSPASRAIAAAYVRGVNRWIARHRRPLGPEFQVLRFRPAPWTVTHCFEVARIMAWDLVNHEIELNLARAAARVGPDRVMDLMPAYPDSGPDILPPGSGRWSAGPGLKRRAERGRRPSHFLARRDIPAIPPLAAALLEAGSIARASNAWVVGGTRTRSGKPILTNDPHLALRAPALWYLVALASPGYRVAGSTIPGLPPIIIGRNRWMAWGLTNVGVDDVDYVIERLSPDSSRVLTPVGWQPVEVVRDEIRVRGRPAVAFTLRRTAHGPLVAGAPGGTAGEMLALRWNAHDPSDELGALLGVNRARNWAEFTAALRGFAAPEQNWIYADVDGNIGYRMAGRVPVRRSGNGLLPTPGWTDEGRWERYLGFEELPYALNPPDDFIVTANNRVVGSEYPHFVTANWALPYRAIRIRELIRGRDRLTRDAVRRMQMDTLDVFARWAKGIAARAADSAGRPDVAAALRAWDGTAGADGTAPTVFYVWYRALQRLTYEDVLDGWAPSAPLHRWLAAGASSWFDDTRTPEREDLPALATRAMRWTLAGGWERKRWGAVHQTLSRHALGGVALLNRLLGLNVGPAPRAGSLYTVNVAEFGSLEPPFLNSDAASFRQVVDLGDIERAGMITTTGQSGNPLGRRYRDQVARWWRGELWAVPLDPAAVRPVAVLHLVP